MMEEQSQPAPEAPPILNEGAPAAEAVKFSFGRWLWAILTLLMVLNLTNLLVSFFSSLREEAFEYERVSQVCGMLFGVVMLYLVFYFLGWVGYRLAHRNVRVGRITVGVFAVLGIAVVAMNAHRTYINRQVTGQMKAINQTVQDIRNSNVEQMKKGTTVVPDFDKLNTVQGQLTSAFDQLGGDRQVAGQVLVEFNQQVIKAATAYHAANAALQDADGYDRSTITDPAVLDQRIELISKIIDAGDAMGQLMSDAPQSLAATMKARGVPEAIGSAMREAALSQMNLKLAQELRKSDHAYFAALRSENQVLKDNWDAWKWNPDRHTLQFSDSDVLKQFNDFAHQAKAASDEIVTLQAKLVELQSKGH